MHSALTCAFLFALVRVTDAWLTTLPRPRSAQLWAVSDAAWVGVLKQEAQDFLVVEDLVLQSLDRGYPAKDFEVGVGAKSIQEHVELGTDAKQELESWLRTSAGLTDSQMTDLSRIANGDDLTMSKLLQLPALDKVQRTAFHQNLRKLYPVLESKTEKGTEDATTSEILVYRKGAKSVRNSDSGLGGGKQAVVQFWDKSIPEYYHFTVQKSYSSTSEAIGELARSIGELPRRFAHAGTKDRRATTAQRLSVYRADPAKLKSLCSVQGIESSPLPHLRVKNNPLRVYDMCASEKPLFLGGLGGNLFCVTMRPAMHAATDAAAAAAAAAAASSVQIRATKPFANLFGPQRFGSPLPINPLVGRFLLQGDLRRAVLSLLLAPSTSTELQARVNEKSSRGGSHGWGLPELEEIVDRYIGTLDHANGASDTSSSSDGEKNGESEAAAAVEHFVAKCWGEHVAAVEKVIDSSEQGRGQLQTEAIEAEELEVASAVPLAEPVEATEQDAGNSGSVKKLLQHGRDRDRGRAAALLGRLELTAALLRGLPFPVSDESAGESSNSGVEATTSAALKIPRTASRLLSLPGVPMEIRDLLRGLAEECQARQARGASLCGSVGLRGLDFAKVFNQAYSPSLRALFVNAVQAELFNVQALERMARMSIGAVEDCFAVEGDVVVVDGATGQGMDAWTCSVQNVNLNAQALRLRHNRTSIRANEGDSFYIHIVDATDAVTERFSASCVVLPLPGLAVPAQCLGLPLRLENNPFKAVVQTLIGDPEEEAETEAEAETETKGGEKDNFKDKGKGKAKGKGKGKKSSGSAPNWAQVPGAYRHILISARRVGCVAVHADDCFTLPSSVTEREREPGSVARIGSEDDSSTFSRSIAELVESGRLSAYLRGLLSADRQQQKQSQEEQQRDCLRIVFGLPAGSYATTLLDALELVQGQDQS